MLRFLPLELPPALPPVISWLINLVKETVRCEPERDQYIQKGEGDLELSPTTLFMYSNHRFIYL